ncbi:hypothetical protein LCGC14_0878020 [marine sediment metagenome]|uniref:Uncharacterized protein n=1 Tax=marine sediment metagenome TaxID=412755 RepID=A0A0F9P2N2_9ZZZZ
MKAYLHNLIRLHHRLMAHYLKRHNWVVFYLEPKYRKCDKDCCWLKLYESENKKLLGPKELMQNEA